MSDERRQHANPPDVPAGDPAPSDRLDSVRPDAAERDQPAVYGTATPGGGRRGFLRTLSHGVAAGSAAALASCGKKEEGTGTTGPSASTYTLSGTVTSQANGAAISGATVQIMDGPNAGKTATTSSSGSYSITGLTTGGGTVRASATGYNPVSTGVTIVSNTTQNFSLPLPVQTTFTMAGVVSNKNTGRAIGNATVKVLDGPNANKTDDTDGNGYYSIPALVRGGFTARGSATGFVALDKAVGIDGDTRVDFQLTPVAGTPCSCEPVCTCNPLCTCNPVCTCDTYSSCTCQSYGHYWYPN
jgi:hypothetical protein